MRQREALRAAGGPRVAAGQAQHRARIAAESGYADQAHFTRDFTAPTGESPTRSAERYPRAPVSG
jgi:AraC-like DNA-binding protein